MTTLDRIKKILKERGFSMQFLADKAGISRNNIYKWNKSKPNANSIEKVANILDVSVDYLLGKEDKPSKSENVVDLDDLSQIMRFQGREIPDSQKEIVLKILKELNDEHNNQ